MVVTVSLSDKIPKVHEVVAAVDCGIVVNPDIVRQQCESATNFGLSAALTGMITIAKGRVQQNNLYHYKFLRVAATPPIKIEIIPSEEPPTGIGELCTPPIAPVIATPFSNAEESACVRRRSAIVSLKRS